MTTIIFIPERGGLGDSTIGCMNAFILAKVLNATFKIVNGPINFYSYFDIPEIFKLNNISKYDNYINYEPVKKYNDYLEVRQNGTKTGSSGSKTNENANLLGNDGKKNYFINKEGRVIQSAYQRIFIRHIRK